MASKRLFHLPSLSLTPENPGSLMPVLLQSTRRRRPVNSTNALELNNLVCFIFLPEIMLSLSFHSPKTFIYNKCNTFFSSSSFHCFWHHENISPKISPIPHFLLFFTFSSLLSLTKLNSFLKLSLLTQPWMTLTLILLLHSCPAI